MTDRMTLINALATITGEIATKTDLDQLRTATKTDLDQLRTATKTDLDRLRAEVEADFGQLRAGVKADIAEVKVDILKWVIGAIGFQTVVVAGLFRLLH